MPSAVEMSNRQSVDAGLELLDKDGQPFASLPDGVTAEFVSSAPNVADFVVGPDGINGTVTSGQVGTCTITATVTGLPPEIANSDTLAVAVKNSAPGALNFRVGTPAEETP